MKNGQSGYTLIETVVALSLFLLVLIPATFAIVRFAGANDNMLRAEALRIAQYHIESRIGNPADASAGETKIVDDRFVIVITTTIENNLIAWQVLIFRSNDLHSSPLVSLKTTRLHDARK